MEFFPIFNDFVYTQKKLFFSNNYSKKLYQSRTKLYHITIISILYRYYIEIIIFLSKLYRNYKEIISQLYRSGAIWSI